MIHATGYSTIRHGADSDNEGHDPSPVRAALVAGDWMRTAPGGAETRVIFQRMLAAWASDVLALRARGLDRPGRRTDWRIALKPAA